MPTDLKTLFGSESLTFDQLEAKINAAGAKFADLSSGDYVSKQKYSDLERDHNKLKEDNATVIKERDTLKAAETAKANLKTVKDAGVSEEYAEFVLSKAEKDVTDKVDLSAATKAYLAEHPQYKAGKTVRRVSSQSRDDGDSGDKSTNAIMNSILRGEKK